MIRISSACPHSTANFFPRSPRDLLTKRESGPKLRGMQSADYQENIRSQECLTCGITFAITATFEKHLRRTQRFFHCPNGHAQSYANQLEIEKLQARIAELES